MTAGQERLVERLLGRELDFVVLGGIAFAPIAFEDEIAIQRLPAEPAVIVAREGHPEGRASRYRRRVPASLGRHGGGAATRLR